jgi:hypothetical protein
MTLYASFCREIAAMGLPVAPAPGEVVDASQIASLPEAAQRFPQFMGVLGRTRDWSFRLGLRGRFRTKPDKPWLPCEAWQYNNRIAVARIFHIRVRFAGLVPVIARDTYRDGRGRMLIRLLDLVTVGDGLGEEYNIGELVTYLNDAVMICPTMLLIPEISWGAVDDESFDVSLTDQGRTVRARVLVGPNGAPKDFSTIDRFCADPANPRKLVRARWTTPISGWQTIGGRSLPTRGLAVWHLPDGPFPYADFALIPESAAFNVAPTHA